MQTPPSVIRAGQSRGPARAAALLALALSLAGCAIGPAYRAPEVALAGPYHTAAPPPPPGAAPAPPLETWWRGFGDPELIRVVERARAANLDIAQAAARVRASRAVARAAGAAILPSADLDAQAQDIRQSFESPFGAIGRHLPGFERDTPLYDIGAGASWDPDLFGGLRRSRQAAVADAGAEAARAQAVRLAVTADAADAYLRLRAFQARLDVARRQEAIQSDLVGLLERQTSQGVAPERELRQTRAALEAVRATLPPLTTGLETQANRLDVLMGASPGTWRARFRGLRPSARPGGSPASPGRWSGAEGWRAELTAPAPVPAAPTLSLGDGPAGLLRRRPDIRAAEQRMVAANARIGQALAEYYPKVTLAGLVGVESLDAAQLFTPASLQAVGGGALRWRLFDFGRVDAEVAQARAIDAEALAAWRATVLRASEEVEDAVVDLVQQQARAQALERQIAELTIARRQAEQAYEGGVISLVEVRDADRDLLAAADQLAQAREGAARAAVTAYRALGGGWTPQAAATGRS